MLVDGRVRLRGGGVSPVLGLGGVGGVGVSARRAIRASVSLAFGVERGERLKGVERGRGVDVGVLVSESSTNLQRMRLLLTGQSYPVWGQMGVRRESGNARGDHSPARSRLHC